MGWSSPRAGGGGGGIPYNGVYREALPYLPYGGGGGGGAAKQYE